MNPTRRSGLVDRGDVQQVVREELSERHVALRASHDRAIVEHPRVALVARVEVHLDDAFLPDHISVVRQFAVLGETDAGVLVPFRIADVRERIVDGVEVLRGVEDESPGVDPVSRGAERFGIERGLRLLLLQPLPIAARLTSRRVDGIRLDRGPRGDAVVILRAHMMNGNPRRQRQFHVAHRRVVPHSGHFRRRSDAVRPGSNKREGGRQCQDDPICHQCGLRGSQATGRWAERSITPSSRGQEEISPTLLD